MPPQPTINASSADISDVETFHAHAVRWARLVVDLCLINLICCRMHITNRPVEAVGACSRPYRPPQHMSEMPTHCCCWLDMVTSPGLSMAVNNGDTLRYSAESQLCHQPTTNTLVSLACIADNNISGLQSGSKAVQIGTKDGARPGPQSEGYHTASRMASSLLWDSASEAPSRQAIGSQPSQFVVSRHLVLAPHEARRPSIQVISAAETNAILPQHVRAIFTAHSLHAHHP